MASSKSGQKRAQGGGRTPNSEPKVQVFKEFGGVNFENALMNGIDVATADHDDGSYQTDLQMNFVHMQNNVAMASNKTMVTRDGIVRLCARPHPYHNDFTGPVCLIGNKLYAAVDRPWINDTHLDLIACYDLDVLATLEDVSEYVPTYPSEHDYAGTNDRVWTSLDYYDDKLIAMTKQNEIWTGDVSGYSVSDISNAEKVPDPTTFAFSQLTAKGSLSISSSSTATCPFRISVAFTYVNRFGPTKPSPTLVFYANHPVSEWHSGCYLQISGTNPGYAVTAVELYYATDNAMEKIFLGRVDFETTATTWTYSWYGYIDATSMWPTANLIMPTENYTKGVRASRVCDIDGRLYFWGDASEPQRLYIGGNPGNLLSISPGTGGGFVDVEPGTSQAVRHVCKYKTQSGNSIVTMLCDSPNSRKEQRFNLVENEISISNEQNMKSWQAEQVAGAVGCKSYDGAVVCEDGLYSISRYGLALTTMTMEYNSQIRTNYVSDPIKPVFTDAVDMDARLSKAMLLELDGVIYMALGTDSDQQGNLDNVLFCYDIDMKAWWTYTLDVDEAILSLFHVDWQGQREGIGIVTANGIYMLPTTVGDDWSEAPEHDFLIETAELSTQMPQQGWQWLSQLEFHFDYFVGEMDIVVCTIDMFGRRLEIKRHVASEDVELYDYTVRMRIDQRVMSYVITFSGQARFRLTHWLARVYTLSNKVGQVWGFDDSISHRSTGDVQQTFKCYNDIRRAIFT